MRFRPHHPWLLYLLILECALFINANAGDSSTDRDKSPPDDVEDVGGTIDNEAKKTHSSVSEYNDIDGEFEEDETGITENTIFANSVGDVRYSGIIVPPPVDDEDEDEFVDDTQEEDALEELVFSRFSKKLDASKEYGIVEEPVVLSEEQKQAERLYELAHSFLNASRPDKQRGYDLLVQAANLGHSDAKEQVAWSNLLGSPLKLDIQSAFDTFNELAMLGRPAAQMGLGFIYGAGIGTDSNQAKAVLYYTFAAFGGDPWAQMAIGYRYMKGLSVGERCERALDFYQRAASKVADKVSISGGSAIQRIRLLDEFDMPGYPSGILGSELINYYELLANKGEVQAQFALGQLHYQGGRGVERNHLLAYNFFKQAARAGNAMAMAYLGKLYYEGSADIPQSDEKAFMYFKQAADLDNPAGQSGLGLMYLHGRGVSQSNKKAMEYFTLAGDKNWVDGQLHLGLMHSKGIGVPVNHDMAFRYFTLAAHQGHILAIYNLAEMHASGRGTLMSCSTSVELYKAVAERGMWGEKLMEAFNDYKEGRIEESFMKYALLAELGYEVGQSNAAYILDKRQLAMYSANESYARALIYWTRSSSQGYSAARVKLGDYYYYGYGTEVDYEAAATHYRYASDQQQNPQAMFNLGYMHEKGLGMKQDIHLAKRFYDLAAEVSEDAKVPVALALTKLSILFTIKYLKENVFIQLPQYIYNPDAVLGSNWDIYMMSLLMVILSIGLYFRRPLLPNPP